MPNEMILVLGQCGVIAALGVLGAIVFRKSFSLGWFVGALALYVIYDFFLTRGFWLIPDPLPDADWNWTGKIMSLTAMLGVAALPIFGFKRVGVTWRQGSKPLLVLVVLAAFCAYYLYSAISTGDGQPDSIETIAFQWTMPGLDEELFYRGVLLVAMNEAFRARANILGAPIGYGGILTSVLFGLAHGMDYGDGAFSFDMALFLNTGVSSLSLLWARERTGSILLPILGHNIGNGVWTLF